MTPINALSLRVAHTLTADAATHEHQGDHRRAAALYRMALEYALGDRDAEQDTRELRRDPQITNDMATIADHHT